MLANSLERLGTDDGLALDLGDVHIWFAALDYGEAIVERLGGGICAEERQRAMRFRFKRDRQRFIVARAVLREILGLYLGVEPQELSFRYGQFGKPALAGGLDHSQVRFNVTHSGGSALYAVVKGREVGIDLELLQPLTDMWRMAQDCFSASENAFLEVQPEQKKLRAFFDGWTRKEAFLKATGYGLSLSPKVVEVSLLPGTGPRKLEVRGDLGERRKWTLVSLAPHSSYSAALVVEGRDPHVMCGEWVAEDLEQASGCSQGLRTYRTMARKPRR
jgi:4'-phosphopantetheinyl transferase